MDTSTLPPGYSTSDSTLLTLSVWLDDERLDELGTFMRHELDELVAAAWVHYHFSQM